MMIYLTAFVAELSDVIGRICGWGLECWEGSVCKAVGDFMKKFVWGFVIYCLLISIFVNCKSGL